MLPAVIRGEVRASAAHIALALLISRAGMRIVRAEAEVLGTSGWGA